MADDFKTTRWSIVRAAGGDAPERDRALAWLCQAYWYPIYAFVRRRGHEAEDARDLVQSFFATLLEKDPFRGLDPDAGKFRAFLLASVKNFAANERAREGAEKRRTSHPAFTVSLDDAEQVYAHEPAGDLDAERLFERRWALAVLARATGRLREEYRQAGRARWFDALERHLSGEAEGTYAETADRLDMSVSAVKTSIHRMRKRLGRLLRDEVAETVSDPGEVDDEVRHLLRVLG